MHVQTMSLKEADKLVSFYNTQVESIPYCYSVSDDEFMAGIVYESNDRNRINEEQILFVEQNGQVLGFAHLVVLHMMEKGKERQFGLFRFFTYAPGHQAVGQALIEASEAYFRALGLTKLRVFMGGMAYPFYHVGRPFLTDRWGHVFGLLGINGYEVIAGQIFMDWRNFEAFEPTPPSNEIRIDVSQKPHKLSERPGLNIEIFKGEKCVGQCNTSPVGRFQRSAEAQDQFYVGWLGVNESMQRKGWGRYMMDRTHWEMKQLGFQHATIGTELDNYRAMCLYLNQGYRLLFTEYKLGKNLE